jgi:hypothetical protein
MLLELLPRAKNAIDLGRRIVVQPGDRMRVAVEREGNRVVS